ncbi:hypothetical protein [Rubricoccus marinus]|uniref:Aspartate/glutamate/uridylate kinase domain-containing protein n=1 Tax=Rubricoccus marinus TaxID=716817 RepID=A0A259TZ73_9BACT|nr:hypothetical protein [Rubricoccus marinus]OZC02986.1 hypothetical protein BSZ36_08385 [Rubricoccus marinus]
MFVLYLDAYYLGDPLFLTGLARDLKARHDAGGDGIVVVHGLGEAAERALEASGATVARRDGALELATPEAEALAERAGRDLNRQIVHELSEAGVHAVRVSGVDRGLARADGSVGRVSWLADLCRQRAVPVVLTIASGDGNGVREVDPGPFSAALAEKLGAEAVLVLGQPPEAGGEGTGDAEAARVPDAKVLQRIGLERVPVVAIRRSALRRPGRPEGMRIRDSSS